jgi:serine/threonine protein kinase
LVSELRPEDPQAIGPYRLVGQLGQGGMGRVFLAVSPGGRPVAVKAIRAELAADPEFRSRFGREVASARRVSGMYTAQVVDADVDGPVAWMATAYVPGPSLAEAVDNHGPLPEASLLALAAGLAESLNAIHAAGVVHRDLKPSNVLLAEDGPRVIDFGISRAVEAVTMLTQAGLVVGSPGFMSPEQAMGGEIGPPSDVFNLGAVLAFAATGEGPFGTGTTAALLYRVAHGEPDLARVPPRVRPLIERCLAKDPAQRPTASGLLAEVGALQPDGNWLPESLTRTFAASAAAGAMLAPPSIPGLSRSRPGFAPPGGPAFAPARGPAGAPSDPGFAPTRGPGYAPSNPGSATPGPVSAPSSGSGYPPLGPGLAAYAAPEPGLTPTRTTAAGAGTLPTPPPGYTSPAPPPGYGPTAPPPGYGSAPPPGYGSATPPLGYGSATTPLGNTPPTPPGGMYGPPGGGNQPRRRRVRPLMLALIIGVMLGAIGAAVFVVTAATKHTPTPLNDRPAAVTSSAPAPSSSAPSSSPPTPTHSASSSAPAYTPPPASVTPTPTPTTPTPTPTTPTPTPTTPTPTPTTPTPTATTSTPTATPVSTPPSSGTTSTSGSTPAAPPSSAPSS